MVLFYLNGCQCKSHLDYMPLLLLHLKSSIIGKYFASAEYIFSNVTWTAFFSTSARVILIFNLTPNYTVIVWQLQYWSTVALVLVYLKWWCWNTLSSEYKCLLMLQVRQTFTHSQVVLSELWITFLCIRFRIPGNSASLLSWFEWSILM